MFSVFDANNYAGLKSFTINAARVIILDDDNLSELVIYSLEEINYSIETSNDDNKTCYLTCTIDGSREIIGTCTVIVVDENNPNGYVLCSDSGTDSSFDTLTIVITNQITNTGYVSSVDEDLLYVFRLNGVIELVR